MRGGGLKCVAADRGVCCCYDCFCSRPFLLETWQRGEGPDTDAGSVCSIGLCDRVILVVRCRHDFIKSGYSDLAICRKNGPMEFIKMIGFDSRISSEFL